MDSVLDVKCPHCGAHGQVVMPSGGTILVGPCPTCQEMVAVFGGCAFSLQRDIILNGTPEEMYDHLLSVLSPFLETRIDQLVEQIIRGTEELDDSFRPREGDRESPLPVSRRRKPDSGTMPITAEEIRRFTEYELPRLDDRDYFRAQFE